MHHPVTEFPLYGVEVVEQVGRQRPGMHRFGRHGAGQDERHVWLDAAGQRELPGCERQLGDGHEAVCPPLTGSAGVAGERRRRRVDRRLDGFL